MTNAGLLKHCLFILTFAVFCYPLQQGLASGRSDYTDMCLKCHPDAQKYVNSEVVHEPVSVGACTACHNPHVSRHEGLLNDTGENLCYECHKKENGFTGQVIHEPLKKEECLQCHAPHSSNNPGLLRQALSETCFKCHDKAGIISKKNVHPEVKKLRCGTCHAPHSSDIPGLLVKEKRKLCADCHYRAIQNSTIPCRYDVRGSDCISCHNPHSSDRVGILKESLHKPFGDYQCSACHSNKSEWRIEDDYKICLKCHKNSLSSFNKINSHMVVGDKGRFCGNCHNPHASDGANLIKGSETTVCYYCHDDSKKYMVKSRYVHPKMDECSQCHESHGSNNSFFLKKGNDTCSTEDCHATQGVFTHPVGEEIIDPRSNAPMSCSTCHNPMGTSEEHFLRWDKDRELCIKCHQV